MRAAPLRRVSSAPPSASVKTVAGNWGKGEASRLEALHQQRHRERRVDRQSQFGLEVLGNALRARAQSRRARDDRARVAHDRTPASVRVGVLVERSNSATPSVVSIA